MGERFEIVLSKEVDVRQTTLIIGFPGVGLISTIAVNFMVDSLKMDLVGYLRSEKLPPAAVVQDGIPLHPVRIYRKDNLMMLLSDFQIPVQLASVMSDTILSWVGDKSNRFKSIITLEGIIAEPTAEEKEVMVYGVGSTDPAREMLKTSSIQVFDHGWITGVSGLLLSDGRESSQNVICLLADANAMYPDARSAAKLVETIDELLPEIKLDLKPLIEEADKIEENIKSQMEKAKDLVAARQVPADRMAKSYMYG